jgi:hypothetical protein
VAYLATLFAIRYSLFAHSPAQAPPHSGLSFWGIPQIGEACLEADRRDQCGVLALALAAAEPAAAQLVYPVPPGPALAMPPHEVVAMVRSTGLEPLSRPVRHGPAWVLRAVSPAGQEMRVVVDARLGRIVRVAPMLGPRYAASAPPPYGRPPGRITLVTDGYGPNSRIAALPPDLDGSPLHGPAGVYDGWPGARAPAALAPPSAQAGPPPLPRPRPNVASAAKPATDVAPAAPPAPKETAAAPAAVAPPPVEMQE